MNRLMEIRITRQYQKHAPKSSPVRPLACNWYMLYWYNCAQLTAKPKAACALASAEQRRRAALACEHI